MKIISGGQTGADLAALQWAKARGWPTGGTMPRGFRREDGLHPEMAILFGMIEHPSPAYPPRTECNVKDSGATLIFGDDLSPGCRLTKRLCWQHKKQYWVIPMRGGVLSPRYIEGARSMILTCHASVLNVAGNREHKNPGISDFTKECLTRIFGP